MTCLGAVSVRTLNRAHLARNVSLLALLATGLASNALQKDHPGSAAQAVAIMVGAIMALLLVRLDDLIELFAPMQNLTPKDPG